MKLSSVSALDWRLTESPPLLGLTAVSAAVLIGLLLAWGGPLAGAGVVLGLTAVVLMLRNIDLGFAAVIGVICLLPFATLPVDVGLTPTFLNLALIGAVGAWGWQIASGQRRQVVIAPITLPLIIFMLVALFAFTNGLQYGPLTPTLLRRFVELLVGVGFALVVIDYCRHWSQVERLTKLFLKAGTGTAVIGIFIWLLPPHTTEAVLNGLAWIGYPSGWVVRYIEDNPALAERAIGTLIDPNALGGLLVLVGALAGPQLVAKRPLLPRWMTAVIVGLIFLCLLLTFSRGALVGLVAAWGAVALVRYRRLIPLMILVGALMLALPITQTYVLRFVEGLQGQDIATQMRFSEYRNALATMGRYPLFGVGFAGSPDVDLFLGVSSLYLTIGQRMGAVGLLAFFSVMAAFFGYAFNYRRAFLTDERRDSVWLGLYAAVVGGLAVGVFDHYLFNENFSAMGTAFWLLIGLATAATRIGAEELRTS
jgi:polysaccharide biosynthesis protein PslJ